MKLSSFKSPKLQFFHKKTMLYTLIRLLENDSLLHPDEFLFIVMNLTIIKY